MKSASLTTPGFLETLAAGSLAAVNAVPVLFDRVLSQSRHDPLLGVGAVVLLNETPAHGDFKSEREGPVTSSLRRFWIG